MGGLARKKSDALFAEALERIPGGVNSPVRAFRAVGGKPFFVDRARGCRVWDVDGNEYIDYIGTWGPAIHGHAHPRIIEAIRLTAGDDRERGRKRLLELFETVGASDPTVLKARRDLTSALF